MTHEDDQAFIGAARKRLDTAAQSLDAATLAQLAAARARALAAEAPVKRHTRTPARWWPLASGAVATGVLAVAVAWWLLSPAPSLPLAGSFEDLDILAAHDAPDFYADYEFYRWLVSQRDAG